jgi:hypothetical protein
MELSTTREAIRCYAQHFMEPEGLIPNSQDLSLATPMLWPMQWHKMSRRIELRVGERGVRQITVPSCPQMWAQFDSLPRNCLHFTGPKDSFSTSHHPTSPRSILILSTHLRLGLPSGLHPSGFPTNNLYAFRFSPIRATCSAHLIHLDLIILIILSEDLKCYTSKYKWWVFVMFYP